MSRLSMLGATLALAVALPVVARAGEPARTYQRRPEINVRVLEKVPLQRGHSLYLVQDQNAPGRYAAAKGGEEILIGRSSRGRVLLGVARLLGNRVYKSREAIYRQEIKVSSYEEKSVVAFLPSRDPKSPSPRFYSVIGPKNGEGPLLIKRRPSQLVGGKPVEYSILDL